MGPQRIRRLQVSPLPRSVEQNLYSQDKANELGKSRDDLLSILSSFSEQKDRLVQQQDRLVVRDNQITRLEEIIAAQRADKVAHEKLCHTQSGPEVNLSCIISPTALLTCRQGLVPEEGQKESCLHPYRNQSPR